MWTSAVVGANNGLFLNLWCVCMDKGVNFSRMSLWTAPYSVLMLTRAFLQINFTLHKE